MLGSCYSFTMQVIGTILCMATYVLISLNIYGFFSVIA